MCVVWRCECCLGGLLTFTHAMLGPVHHAHRFLNGNKLSGGIPDSIGNLAQLTQLCVGCCVLACVVVWACGLMGSRGVGNERWRVGSWQVWPSERCLGVADPCLALFIAHTGN